MVNYTNRSGSDPIPISTLGWSYLGATTGAVTTALTLNKLAARGPPLAGKLVPLAAVAAANCVNIPMMRFTEIRDGIELQDENGNRIGHSKKCAKEAIASVTLSRIGMASPSMSEIFLIRPLVTRKSHFIINILFLFVVVAPIIINFLEKRKILARGSLIAAPIQVGLCGLFLTFATPLGCALFSQRVTVPVANLEPEVRDQLSKKHPNLTTVYYNKGL